MGCCESEKYKRAKDFDRMVLLGTQTASITGANQVIVKRLHGRYGYYYEVLQEGKQGANEQVLRILRPLPSESVLSDSKPRKPKRLSDRG